MTKAERREILIQLAKTAAFTAIIFAACAIGFDRVCSQDSENTCNLQTSLYFAAQTVTTVGYGVDIHFKTDDLKTTATVASLFGAIAFSLLLSIVATLVQDAALRRVKRAAARQSSAPTRTAGDPELP